ncbi:Uncharacterized protein PCOAH_00036240 [Plasmodium coatneyi]|uniref:HTH OST-type domain-containing protein n=1 Tax=Plasmodium coatneyi TaxID=208452 RepID=A0A1B1E205_9APIC|nr:Uncharacterized protein PCOAH_00036240 [Plasmodium coatneyi]ANQ09064.1 Uncharacterized protein PCOAH_00036240 [Plasmodium coatneyi]
MERYESAETNLTQQPQGSVPSIRSVPLVQGQNKHHLINGTTYQGTRRRNTNEDRKGLTPMSKMKNSNVTFTRLHGNSKYQGEGKNYYPVVNQPINVPVSAVVSNHPNRIQMNSVTHSFNENGESSHMNKFGFHREGRSKNCMLVQDPTIPNPGGRSSYGEYKMSGPKLARTYRNERNSYAVLNRANELNFPPGCNNGMAASDMIQETPPGCSERRCDDKVDVSKEEKNGSEMQNQVFTPRVGGKQNGGEIHVSSQRTEQVVMNPVENLQKGKVDPPFDNTVKPFEVRPSPLQNSISLINRMENNSNGNGSGHQDNYNQVKYLAKPPTREKGNLEFAGKRKNYRNGAYNSFFTPYEQRLNLLKKEPPSKFGPFGSSSKGDQPFGRPVYEKRREGVPRGSGLLPQVNVPPPQINEEPSVVKYSGEVLYNGVTPAGGSVPYNYAFCTPPTLCASPRQDGRASLISMTEKRPRGNVLNAVSREGRRSFLSKSDESVDSTCFKYNATELGSLSPDMRTSTSLNVCLSIGLKKKPKKGMTVEGLPRNTTSMNQKVHPMVELLSNNAKPSSRKKKGSKNFSLNLCSACLNIDDGIYLKQINEIMNRDILFSDEDLLILDELTKSSIHHSYVFNNVKTVSSFRKGGLTWIVYNNQGGWYPCTKAQKQIPINYDKVDTDQQSSHIGGVDMSDGECTYVDLIRKNIFCTSKYVIEPTIENTWLKKVLLIIKKEDLDLDAFFFKLKYYFYKSVLFLYQEGIKSYLGDVANQMKIYVNYNFWSASEVAYILRQLTNLCSIQIEVRVKGEIGCVIYLNEEPKGFQGFVDSHNLNDTFTKKDWILLHRFAIKMMQYRKEGNDDKGSDPSSPTLPAMMEEQGKVRHSENGTTELGTDGCVVHQEDGKNDKLPDELVDESDVAQKGCSSNVDFPFGEDKSGSDAHMELLSPASVAFAAALSEAATEEEPTQVATKVDANVATDVTADATVNPQPGRSEDGSECIFCSPTTKKLKSYMFNGGRYAFAAKLKHEIKHFKSKRLGDIIHLVQLAIHKGIFVYSQRILLPVSACEKSADDLYPKIKNFNYELCDTLGEVMRIISLLVDHKPNGLVLAQLKQQFILQFKKELNSLHFGYKKLQNLLLAEPFSKHYKLYIPNCNMHRTHIQHKKYRIPDNCRIFQKESINVGSFLEFIDHHEFDSYSAEEGEDEEEASVDEIATSMSDPLPGGRHTNELLNHQGGSENAGPTPSISPIQTENQKEKNQHIQMYRNAHVNTTEESISKGGTFPSEQDQTDPNSNVATKWQMNKDATKPRGMKKREDLSYRNLKNLPLFIRESIEMTLEGEEDDGSTFLDMEDVAQFCADQEEGSIGEGSKQRNDMHLSTLSRRGYSPEEGNPNGGDEAPSEVKKHPHGENPTGSSSVLTMLYRMDLDAEDAHAEKLRGIREIFAGAKDQREGDHADEGHNQQDNIWQYSPLSDSTQDNAIAATANKVVFPPLVNIFTLIKKYKRKRKNYKMFFEQGSKSSNNWRSKFNEEDVPEQKDGEGKSNDTKGVFLKNNPSMGSVARDVPTGSPGNKFLRFKGDPKFCNSSPNVIDMEGPKVVRPFGKNGFYEKGAFTSAELVTNRMGEEGHSGESPFDLNKVRQNCFQYVKKNQGGSHSLTYHLGKRTKSFIKDSSLVAHGGEVLPEGGSPERRPMQSPNYPPPCVITNVKQNGQHTRYEKKLEPFDGAVKQQSDCKLVQNSIPGEYCNISDDTSQTGKNAKGHLYKSKGGEEITPYGDYCQSDELNMCEPTRLDADNGFIDEKNPYGVPPMGSSTTACSVDKKCSPPEGTSEEHLPMGGNKAHFNTYNLTQGKNTNMHRGETKLWRTELSTKPDNKMNVTKKEQPHGDTSIYGTQDKLAEELAPSKSYAGNQTGNRFKGDQVKGLSIDTTSWRKNANPLGPPQNGTNNLVNEQVQNTKDEKSDHDQNDSLNHSNGKLYHVEGENGFPSSDAVSSEKAPAHQAADIQHALNCTYLKKADFMNCDLNRVRGKTDNSSNSTTTTTTTVANNNNGGSNNSGNSDSVADYHSGDSNTQMRDTPDRSENGCYVHPANQVGQESVGPSTEVKTDGMLPPLSGHVEEPNRGLNKPLTYRPTSDEVQHVGGNCREDTPVNSVTQSEYSHQYDRHYTHQYTRQYGQQYTHQHNYPPSDKKRATYKCNDKEINLGKRQYNPFESRNSFTCANTSYTGRPNNLREGYKRENDVKKNFFKKNEMDSNSQLADLLSVKNHAKGEGLFFSPKNEGKNFRNVITTVNKVRQEKLQTPNGSSFFNYRNDKSEHAFKSRSILKRNKYVDPNGGFNQERKKNNNNHQIFNPMEEGYQQRETGTERETQRRTTDSSYAMVDKMDNHVTTYLGRTPDTVLHKQNRGTKNNFLQSSYFPYQQNKKNAFVKYGDVETSYGNHREVKKPQFRKFFNCTPDTGTPLPNEGTTNFGKICKIRNIYSDQFSRKYFPGETNKFYNASLNYSYQNRGNVDLPPASNEYVKFSSLVKGKTRINADPSFVENGAFKVGGQMQDQVRDHASLSGI